ncbi:Protein fam92a1 [Neofusicoccum parvum]|nr:Protein fam92a1 [Neofusicoccum parvum]
MVDLPSATFRATVEMVPSDGGGLWMPAADSLQKLRQDIDRKPHKIKGVLTNARIRKEFFEGIPNDEKKAVRAFAKKNAESALKTRPQGYDKEHRDIELLRLRSFTIGTKLDNSAVVGAGGLQRIADLISCMVPFITYLNSVVMPDAPSSDSDDAGGGASSAEEGAAA